MSKSRLELRSPLWIALAYVVSPICGLNAWMALGLAFDRDADSVLQAWIFVMVFGGAACLIAEAVLVTPILVGFHVWRWRWLNGWSAAAIGFVAAVAGWWVCSRAFPTDDGDPPEDLWHVTADWTLPGWMHVASMQATEAVWYGVIGLVAAMVFRLVAVRPNPLPDWVLRA